MLRGRGTQVKGYMTIEAAFIMNMVIFLLVFLLYLAFYGYDRCVLFQDAYAFAFRVSAKPYTEEEKQQYGQSNCLAQFGKKYFAVKEMSPRITVEKGIVTVQGEMVVTHPFEAIDPVLPKSGWKQAYDVKVSILNPTKELRTKHKLQEYLGMNGE